MPRAGDTYSLPGGYEAVTGETATATQHNSPLEDIESDLNAARPISTGGTGATSAPAARTALGIDPSSSYALKGAGYTLVAADKNGLVEFSGAYTASLTAAATLGSGWAAWIYANGGAVTIDPNSSETINGSSTLSVPDGVWCRLVCNGTNFRAVLFQVYDADTLKADVTDTLTVGYAITEYSGGTISSGTYSPNPANSNMQAIVNDGAFTLDVPTHSCSIVLRITNDTSAGAITTSAYTIVTGDAFTTANDDQFLCYLTRLGGTKHLHVVAI